MTPLPPPEHKIDPHLATQIENALVLQLRSLQLKLNASEAQRAKWSDHAQVFERECTILRSQNEKLAASERKLNEKIWDLELLDQQLKETNEELLKEIQRYQQKIKSYERDISQMKEHIDSMRVSESGWQKEKQTLIFTMESESSRKRREIASLKREKADLERQIEELTKSEQHHFEYKTGASAASSHSNLSLRSKTLESELKVQSLLTETIHSLSPAASTQNTQNDLFVSSLSKALSAAHSQNEDLRSQNATLLQNTQELDRLLREANETIESLKLGCDISSFDRVDSQMFDPSFFVDQSLHDQLACSESMSHALKLERLDENLEGHKSLLAELAQEVQTEVAPAAEALSVSDNIHEELEVLQKPSSNTTTKVMADFSCQTEEAPRLFSDTKSILNELSEQVTSLGPESSFEDDVSSVDGVSIRSGAGAFSIADTDVENIFNHSLAPKASRANGIPSPTAWPLNPKTRARSPELILGPGGRLQRQRSEVSFDHQTQEYVEYDGTAIEALTTTMIGTYFRKFNRHGKKPQLRFFWVNPYSRLLNWTQTPPSGNNKGITKTAYIKQIKWTDPPESHKNYPPNDSHAIEIISRQRSIVLIPLTWQDQRAWIEGISLLLNTGNEKSTVSGQGELLHERFKIVDTNSPRRGDTLNTPRRSFTQPFGEDFGRSMSPSLGRPQTPTFRVVPERVEDDVGPTTPSKDRRRGFSRLGFTPLRLSSARGSGIE
ncbi:hypothetical protein BCR33DRAFT_713279 [Rhizoclosmatium globosum]|uniref:Pleckstrin homology domain-containing protein n=1 Tax=Rhizoclosmatium globosum TaxID=329046 RepID=A0A1Y2CTX7_9FUNG|nr:hypothetical protein BCR33DRAFT_713279 [Rhizoclosmatium globosum]|eukprot:ORY50489.1 hypothetical protein BCR33DRAFT_713279 [Rhizoclosmatium globosum]